MNPRDEKLLLLIRKKQNADYENFVPFCIIHKSFFWIDESELSSDLLNLCANEYLCCVPFPNEYSGFFYSLTHKGNRECERIRHDNTEIRKNRNIQLISSLISAIIGAVLGFILGKIT